MRLAVSSSCWPPRERAENSVVGETVCECLVCALLFWHRFGSYGIRGGDRYAVVILANLRVVPSAILEPRASPTIAAVAASSAALRSAHHAAALHAVPDMRQALLRSFIVAAHCPVRKQDGSAARGLSCVRHGRGAGKPQ